MKTSVKFTILTLAIAIPAWFLGGGAPLGNQMWMSLWPWATVSEMEPTGAQLPLFMLLGAISAVAFGAAISFLVWGGGLVRRIVGPDQGRHRLFMVATFWLLGNWWMHESLHIVNGENFTGLLILEYAFHVTLIAAAAYVAFTAYRNWAREAPAVTPETTPAPTAMSGRPQ